jgi:hypothetical protein
VEFNLKRQEIFQILGHNMKKGIYMLTFFLTISSFAQNRNLPKNTFGVGTAIHNRGMINAEHSYYWSPKPKMMMSLESAIGITGSLRGGVFTISPTFNFGSNRRFLSVGMETKYLYKTRYEVTDPADFFAFSSSYWYSGIAFAPFIGYNWFGTKTLNTKVRICLLILPHNFEQNPNTTGTALFRAGIGFSMGLFRVKKKNKT